MNDFVKTFSERGIVIENKPMSQFTTWKVGGHARVIYFPAEIEDVEAAIKMLKAKKIAYRVFGRGSNMLVSDEAYDGVIILLSKMKDKIEQQSKNRFLVSGGFGLQQFSRYLNKHGFEAHEFFSGIPGSVGGGIFMNAGTPQGEIKDVLVKALVIQNGMTKWMSNEELGFSYRTSILQKTRESIVLQGDFYFEEESSEHLGRSTEFIKKDKISRRTKQPIHMPTAGSVFRNPKEGYSGNYIEQVGLKGYQIGGAKISEMHANFIENVGGATASDIFNLMKLAQEKVYEEFQVSIYPEVELFNFSEKLPNE